MLEITEIPVQGYERVIRGIDRERGLHGIVAVHDTTLGPALGGLRMWPYESEEKALYDVLRLSRGMTYKSAVAKTGLGGGKSVIIGDAKKQKTPALFAAMGELIDSLKGSYITAEDVGIGVEDLELVRKGTKYVSGLEVEDGGSGNPSPYTAHGTFVGIKACLEEVFGSADMKGKVVAIQGVGAVAKGLCEAVVEQGGRIVACDVNPDHLEWARTKVNAQIVGVDEIYDVPCDVFSPSALGAILNDRTIPRLATKIVAGCANNQLEEPRHAKALEQRGILYAPDYVINAGGIINVSCEFAPGGYREALAMPKIENIYRALKDVFSTAKREKITTAEAADRVAERILAEGRAQRAAVSAG
jgi:leucine dehydrogenase